jgi:hypothetical protein
MKKLTLIAMALVVAVGAMGVGYALWSDSLYLEGTVYTGDIGLEWSQGVPYDTEIPEKDVSYGVCEIQGDLLIITIYNAYPSIEYHFPLDIHGTGTVPVHTQMTWVGGNANPAWLAIPDLSGLQVHQSDVYNFELVVHLDNTAIENSVYTFAVQLDYWQYNEDAEANALGFPFP